MNLPWTVTLKAKALPFKMKKIKSPLFIILKITKWLKELLSIWSLKEIERRMIKAVIIKVGGNAS